MRLAPLLLLALPAAAQRVVPALKAGVPLTGLLAAAAPEQRAKTRRWTAGPAVDVRLWRGLAVEFDALYKRIEYGSWALEAASGRWEFPLLVKRRFSLSGVGLFAGAGGSFNWIRGRAEPIAELRHRGTRGLLVAAGIERPVRRFRLSSELRVTRWADRNFGVRDAPLRSKLTQVEILTGMGWR